MCFKDCWCDCMLESFGLICWNCSLYVLFRLPLLFILPTSRLNIFFSIQFIYTDKSSNGTVKLMKPIHLIAYFNYIEWLNVKTYYRVCLQKRSYIICSYIAYSIVCVDLRAKITYARVARYVNIRTSIYTYYLVMLYKNK